MASDYNIARAQVDLDIFRLSQATDDIESADPAILALEAERIMECARRLYTIARNANPMLTAA